MKPLIIVILLTLTNKSFAQIIYTVNHFSKEYYGKIYIADTSSVYSNGWVAIYDRKTNKQIIKVTSDELALSLHNDRPIANIDEFPYGEQSLIMYEDFNFDGKKDFAIEDGQNSCYHGPSFRIYLATNNGFVFSKDFTKLAQDYCGMFQVDQKEKRILTMTKSGCCWHQFSEFIVKNNEPKAVSIITDEQDLPFDIYTVENWNGRKMIKKETRTIDMDQDGIKTVLSFLILKSGNRVILYNINDRTLNYVFVRKDSTVEFFYPKDIIYENPDFTFDTSAGNRTIIFKNDSTTYTIYDEHGEVGINIDFKGKSYNLVGDDKTVKGKLNDLLKVRLDNVIYK